jgi:hypothetical protein
MSDKDNNVKEKLLTLEKHVKKILRKSLKNSTLDYSIQFSVSNVDAPGKVKYAAMISSPAKGVQPITFMADSYDELEAVLKAGEKGINKKAVELTFHESRINSYKARIAQHEERMKKLNDPEYDESEEEIEMELVS